MNEGPLTLEVAMLKKACQRLALVVALLSLGGSDLLAACWECSQVGSCVPVGYPKSGFSQCSSPEIGICILSGHTCSPFGPQRVAADGSLIENRTFAMREAAKPSGFYLFAGLPRATERRNCQGMIVARLMRPDIGAKVRSSAYRMSV